MSGFDKGLSSKSRAVLEMIAAGRTYEQILSAYPEMGYLDIFFAAEEALALGLATNQPPSKKYTLAEKRERHTRAYEAWSDDEDRTLGELVRSGETVARIAGQLKRNRGAIRSRMMKLNLVSFLIPREQRRFRRIMERQGHP